MELTIYEKTYQFKAGFGFLREVNKKYKDSQGNDIGVQMIIAGVIDNDPMLLAEALLAMNKSQGERISKETLERFLEDEDTDIDEVFRETLDFFESANCTKAKTKVLLDYQKKQKEKEKNEEAKK